MKLRLGICLFIVLSFLLPKSMLGTTWYVRADGGSRYSPSALHGQCDGQSDVAYPGSGVNRHCAFGDYRFLWDDQSYGNSQWVIAGGDTVIVDNTKQWRVGFDGDGTSVDAWCFGGNGPYDCTNPTIPAGTAAHHTRLLGRNYANCSTRNASLSSKMTQIFGGHGVYAALNLTGAQFVDVQCMEITRHSQCITHGLPAYPSTCNRSFPLDDYDSDGITTDVATHDLTLQDLWIHGHTDRGIIGPIGGSVIATRIDVAYNGMAGWDFDNGSGTPSVNATLHLNYSTIEWSGCNQQYPINDVYPAISCYSQSSGGYGDGIGTPSGMGMDVFIDHSIFRYNTQDGEDFGHIDSGTHTLQLTNSLSYGNSGAQFKWGPNFTSVVFENNLAVGNCLRMSKPISGAPATFNQNLRDFCRAEDALSFNFRQGGTALFANNSIVSYAPTTFDMQCVDASCSKSTLTLTNNVVRGYDNPATYNLGGQSGGPGTYCGDGCNGSKAPIGTIRRSHNLYFGMRGSCIAGVLIGDSTGTAVDESCTDPLLIGEPLVFRQESDLDNYNFAPAFGSPLVQMGIAVAGLTTDYSDNARPNPPSIGALELIDSAITPDADVASTTRLAWSSPGPGYASLLTAAVAPKSSSGTPSGTVTLSVLGYQFTALTLDSTGKTSALFPSWLSLFYITANYAGDATFLPSSYTISPK